MATGDVEIHGGNAQAGIAQMAERRFCTPQVGGSMPLTSSNVGKQGELNPQATASDGDVPRFAKVVQVHADDYMPPMGHRVSSG